MLTAPEHSSELAGVVTVHAGLPKNGAKTEPFWPHVLIGPKPNKSPCFKCLAISRNARTSTNSA